MGIERVNGRIADIQSRIIALQTQATGRTVQSQSSAATTIGTGGDDYEVVCTLPPGAPKPAGLTVIGEVRAGSGVEVRAAGQVIDPGAGGWTHS